MSDRWIALDALEFWKENPNEGDIGSIYNSIKKFGFWGVFLVWNGIVKGGNHSAKALRWLHDEGKWIPKGDGIRIRDGVWEVRYWDVSHMSEFEANALALALNNTARKGHDDPAKLLALLQAIQDDDAELAEAAGYDQDDIDDLLALVNATGSPQVPIPSDQKEPELPAEHIVEIYCSAEVLEEIRPFLTELQTRDGVMVQIA